MVWFIRSQVLVPVCPEVLSQGVVPLSRCVVPLSRSVCPEVMSRGVGPCRLLIFFFSRREADSATGRGAGRTWLAVAVLHVRVRGCSSVSIVTCVSGLVVCAGCVRVWLCGCARVCVIMAVRVGCECWLCVLAVQASVWVGASVDVGAWLGHGEGERKLHANAVTVSPCALLMPT